MGVSADNAGEAASRSGGGSAAIRTRWNPGRRGVLAMAFVAVLSMALAGAWVLMATPRRIVSGSEPAGSVAPVSPGGSLASPIAPLTSQPASSQPVSSQPVSSQPVSSQPVSSQPGAAVLVVDVVGKVKRPGVYELPSGSRVNDAIRAAGGVKAGTDLTTVNLARKLADGEQIAVGIVVPGGAGGAPATGSGSGTGGGSGGSDSGSGTLLDLNTATVDQLDGLPGVGPVLAQRIVDWRAQHNGFSSVDQLNSVSGIGAAKFADLKPLVTVS